MHRTKMLQNTPLKSAGPPDVWQGFESIAWYRFHEVPHGHYHDYCPFWDYDVEPAESYPLFEEALAQTGSEFMDRIFQKTTNMPTGFEVFLAPKGKLGPGIIGIYIFGTYQLPVIGLCPKTIQDFVPECDLDRAIASTLAHEFAHALQEAYGLEQDHAQAEDFTDYYMRTGELGIHLIR